MLQNKSRKMNVLFKETKTNKIYEEFVNEPTDRKKQRAFNRQFGKQIASEVVKLHQRLKAYPTAGAYNKVYGSTRNRVETKSGVKNNAPMIFKVRVTGSWRKFFNNVIDVEGNLLVKKDWDGDFGTIVDIYVIDVNNHEYDAV